MSRRSSRRTPRASTSSRSTDQLRNSDSLPLIEKTSVCTESRCRSKKRKISIGGTAWSCGSLPRRPGPTSMRSCWDWVEISSCQGSRTAVSTSTTPKSSVYCKKISIPRTWHTWATPRTIRPSERSSYLSIEPRTSKRTWIGRTYKTNTRKNMRSCHNYNNERWNLRK